MNNLTDIFSAYAAGNSFIMQNSAGTQIGPFTGTVILSPGTKNGTIFQNSLSGKEDCRV